MWLGCREDDIPRMGLKAPSGVHQMEPPCPLISWVNPFPRRFINRTTLFCNALESHECACCLLFEVRQYYCHSSIFTGSFLYKRAKPSQGTVLFINLLRKGSTPMACMGDGGSIWWAPGPVRISPCPSVQKVEEKKKSLRKHKHKVGPVTNCYQNGWHPSPFNNNKLHTHPVSVNHALSN